MAERLIDIVATLDALLDPERFQDYCPNGLQVPGAEQVCTVVTGVSAHLELFELARAHGAELVLVHHGIFWGSPTGPIDTNLKRRLKVLFDADMSLVAYHLPLDAHLELGNNALLARGLGASSWEPFGLHRTTHIGVLAQFSEDGLKAADLWRRIATLTDREPLIFDCGPDRIRRLAVVSGAGSDHIGEACAAGADALLTGEPAERTMAQAREAGIHVIAAGHYATETFGVRALGELLAERFGLAHVFMDVPNPV